MMLKQMFIDLFASFSEFVNAHVGCLMCSLGGLLHTRPFDFCHVQLHRMQEENAAKDQELQVVRKELQSVREEMLRTREEKKRVYTCIPIQCCLIIAESWPLYYGKCSIFSRGSAYLDDKVDFLLCLQEESEIILFYMPDK